MLGFLGPGPVGAHLDHAGGFAEALVVTAAGGGGAPARAADLGSGGGVPALVLALRLPETEWVLIEAMSRRAAFLREAVEELGLGGRASVVEDRAEAVGRGQEHRGAFDVVTARGFGPPAVVAECAAPLLRVGGRAVVSEPPGGEPGRWPVAGLALVGLAPLGLVAAAGATYQVLRQVETCSARWPRRVGIPGKRPLF